MSSIDGTEARSQKRGAAVHLLPKYEKFSELVDILQCINFRSINGGGSGYCLGVFRGAHGAKNLLAMGLDRNGLSSLPQLIRKRSCRGAFVDALFSWVIFCLMHHWKKLAAFFFSPLVVCSSGSLSRSTQHPIWHVNKSFRMHASITDQQLTTCNAMGLPVCSELDFPGDYGPAIEILRQNSNNFHMNKNEHKHIKCR
ncbi:AAEL004038-PA [Aedes aegypti]|uniref:AAEL004038-PA n=1 Tax=Aedes aegypti TaxID=7159 RepID=Q17DZ1_AEDAE|nr:AAEL004038-PA [Aedes aegypti]